MQSLCSYSQALRDNDTVRKCLKDLTSLSRWELHGTLRVALSASVRVVTSLRELLDGEEEHGPAEKDPGGGTVATMLLTTPARRRGRPKASDEAKPTAKAKPAQQPPPEVAPPKATKLSSAREATLAMLAKRAMNSADIVAALRPQAPAATVYQALALLRDAKVIETRIDDADGERKNFLVKPQEQGK